MDLVHERDQLTDMFEDMDGKDVVNRAIRDRETEFEISYQIDGSVASPVNPNCPWILLNITTTNIDYTNVLTP